MIYFVAKSTSINLRITPEFRAELERLAGYNGLTLSAQAHSLLVRALRQEKEDKPEVFDQPKFNFVKKQLKGKVNESDVKPRKSTGTG